MSFIYNFIGNGNGSGSGSEKWEWHRGDGDGRWWGWKKVGGEDGGWLGQGEYERTNLSLTFNQNDSISGSARR